MTLLSNAHDWWVGVRDVGQRLGAAVDLAALRAVPVQTLVGGADLETAEITHREGGRYWMPDANMAGATRLERLEALRQSLVQAGMDVSHEVIAGVAHNPWPIIARAKLFLAARLAQRRTQAVAADA